MLITLIFISVTIFITSCNNDEYDVFSETIFYGEWVNEDGTLYYCSDGTFSFYNNSSSGTWSVYDNELHINFDSGNTGTYEIIEADEYSYKIKKISTGDIWNAVKQSDDGCYVPTSSAYDGTWERSDAATHLYISNTYASLCSGGTTEWTGTFSQSEQKLYLVAEGETYDFDVELSGGNLIVYPGDFSSSHDPATYYSTSNYPCGNTNTSDTGEGMFWTSSDLACGNIDVYVDGSYEGEITSYYSSGVSSCGASGCVTFTRDPGTYSWTADCSNGSWSGNITISEGGCSKMELTNKNMK